MGFSSTLALGTLQLTNGNVERALEMLLAGNGVEAIPMEEQQTQPQSEKTDIETAKSNEPMEVEKESEEELLKREEEARLKREDEEELVQDMPDNDEEAHLDVVLVEEEATLQEYKVLVNNTKA